MSSPSVGAEDVAGSRELVLIKVAEKMNGKQQVVYLLLLQPEGNVERQCYRRVGMLELQPWEYDDENYIGEEIISRLEGAAYEEVTAEEWPKGTFVIV